MLCITKLYLFNFTRTSNKNIICPKKQLISFHLLSIIMTNSQFLQKNNSNKNVKNPLPHRDRQRNVFLIKYMRYKDIFSAWTNTCLYAAFVNCTIRMVHELPWQQQITFTGLTCMVFNVLPTSSLSFSYQNFLGEIFNVAVIGWTGSIAGNNSTCLYCII